MQLTFTELGKGQDQGQIDEKGFHISGFTSFEVLSETRNYLRLGRVFIDKL